MVESRTLRRGSVEKDRMRGLGGGAGSVPKSCAVYFSVRFFVRAGCTRSGSGRSGEGSARRLRFPIFDLIAQNHLVI